MVIPCDKEGYFLTDKPVLHSDKKTALKMAKEKFKKYLKKDPDCLLIYRCRQELIVNTT